MAANSWMQHPVGYVMVNGKPQLNDIWAVFTNPVFVWGYLKVLFASLVTGAVVMLAVSAWQLRHGGEREVFTRSARLALVILVPAILFTMLVGDELGVIEGRYQPMKIAAAEAQWTTCQPCSFSLFQIGGGNQDQTLLNRNYVQSIQITMAEAFDVSDRGRFYDRTGAIRDVLQNHMLQVLATVLAEPPPGADLASWRDAKQQVVNAVSPLTPQNTVRGQYEGYRQVEGVDPNSTVETYVAVRLTVDNWRWAGVPILIRAGKTMPVTATEISITAVLGGLDRRHSSASLRCCSTARCSTGSSGSCAPVRDPSGT